MKFHEQAEELRQILWRSSRCIRWWIGLGLLCVLGWLPLPGRPQVFISEIMTENIRSLKDDEGDYPDWIELVNGSDIAVSMAGWGLTDNASGRNRWIFPETNLGPGEILVVFASGKNLRIPGRVLHTDFKLDSAGDNLILSQPDGTAVPSAMGRRFPAQFPDVSYGVTWVTNTAAGGGATTLAQGTAGYFRPSTPRAQNGEVVTDLGPMVGQLEYTPNEPSVDDPLLVTVRIRATFSEVKKVELIRRVMFGTESTLEMFDDGTHGDRVAGDGRYSLEFPAPVAQPGQMIRHAVVAMDERGMSSREPSYLDRIRMPQYAGTVVKNPSLTNPLPVVHWFQSNPTGADSGETRCSLYFQGKFYDNVIAGVHGQSSQGFPKRSYDFDMLPGRRFEYSPQEEEVDDFNLLTTYPDKAHIRNILAYDVFREAGHPYHVVMPVRVQRNGTFLGDYHWVEDGSAEYLRRVGLNPRGALYKMYDTFSSSTPPGAEKKTRKWEANDDLRTVMSGLRQSNTQVRTRFVYDNVDLPGMANYLAAMVITGGVDCCHKNYYAYRDTEGNREWVFLPWDQDLTFGRNWTGEKAYFDDTMYPANGLFVGSGNLLIDALFADAAFTQMYLRRLRTLMDEQIQPPSAPISSLKLEAKIASWIPILKPDADADYAKWSTWGQRQTFTNAIHILTNNYLPARRKHLYENQVTPRGRIPLAQTNAAIRILSATADDSRGGFDREFVVLRNETGRAVDISGWEIRGAISHRMKPGTVIPANRSLHLSPNVPAFRGRTVSPKGGEGVWVQGNYSGRFSPRGGKITLEDRGTTVDTLALPSIPPVLSAVVGKEGLTVRFEAIEGVRYRIESAPELAGPWSSVQESSGAGMVVEWKAPTNRRAEYFRVSTIP